VKASLLKNIKKYHSSTKSIIDDWIIPSYKLGRTFVVLPNKLHHQVKKDLVTLGYEIVESLNTKIIWK
jgi:hypothetical protein